MAASVFNIAKGRVNELIRRVDGNDPANSAIVIVLLAASGLESHATLIDKDTLADVLSGATNEATNTGYARIVIADSGLAVTAQDDTNDWATSILGDQTFTIDNDGTGAVGAVLVGYDNDTTSGTDSSIVPLTLHDVSWTPNGALATIDEPATGFYKAA